MNDRPVSGEERQHVALELLDEAGNALLALQVATRPWDDTMRGQTVDKALEVLKSAGAEAARLRRGRTTRSTPSNEDTRARLERLQAGARLAVNVPVRQ